jgi:sporulation integral membrane protein YlbJ
MLLYPKEITSSAFNALKMWAEKVVPSLFPFIVAVNIFISAYIHLPKIFDTISRHLFGFNGTVFTSALFSIAAGYPAGAKTALENRKKHLMDSKSTETYLCLSLNASPAFIMSTTANGFLSCPESAVILMFSTVLGNIIAAFIMSRQTASSPKAIYACSKPETYDFFSVFSSSVKTATETVIKVGGYIVFFAVLSEILELSGIIDIISKAIILFTGTDTMLIKGILSGLLEMTNGVKNISLSQAGINIKIIASAFILSFGGLCVHFQSFEFLKDCGCKLKDIIKARLICAVLSLCICFIILEI